MISGGNDSLFCCWEDTTVEEEKKLQEVSHNAIIEQQNISNALRNKDYYEAETDFYKAIRSILKERQNSEFNRAVESVNLTLQGLENGESDPEHIFLIERVRALNSFFNTLDTLFGAIARLDSLGAVTIQTVLKILK